MLPACNARIRRESAQNAAVQRAVKPRDEHLLDVALKAEGLGEIRRVVVFALHLAPRTEQRLEDHPDRLGETGGGVFHLRRQPAQAAIPRRPDAHLRPRAQRAATAPAASAAGRSPSARCPSVETVPPSSCVLPSTQPSARLRYARSGWPVSCCVTGSSSFRNTVGNRPRKTHAAASKPHARAAWSERPRAPARRARCAAGPGR